MPATKVIAAPEFFTWTFPGAPLKIDLSLVVVERLKEEVLNGGESETGGILLGHVVAASPVVIRITGFQPAPLEGRCFYALKGTERRAFMQTVASFRVPGREMAVGYYRSHLRDGLSLDHQDLTLVRTCLPGPTDVVLLMRPEPDGAITAGFFFWDEGHINPEASFLEFPLDAGQLRWQIAKPRPAAAEVPSGVVRKGFGTGVIVGGLGTVLLGGAFLVGRLWQPSSGRTAASLTPVSEMAAERSGPGTRLANGEMSGLAAAPLRGRAAGMDQAILPGDLSYDAEPGRRRSLRARRSPLSPQDSRVDGDGAFAENSTADASTEPAAPAPSPRQFEPPAAVRKAAADAPPEPPLVAATAQTAAAVHPEHLLGNAPPAPQPPPAKETAAATPAPAAPAPAQASPSVPYIAPQPVSQVQPVVPVALRSMLFRPTQVQVKVKVDENGVVVAAEPGKSKDALGNVLGGLAVDAARRWRFKPALRDSHPVAGDAVISFNFVPPRK